MPRFERSLSAVDILFSNFLDPYGTAKHLLVERPSPPYIFTTLLAVVIFLIGPVVSLQQSVQHTPSDPKLSNAVLLTIGVTWALFVLATTVMCKLLGMAAPLIKILAASVYSLSPLVPLSVGVHAASYLIDGRAAVIEYYALGILRDGDIIVWILPYIWIIAGGYAFVVFLNSMRALGRGSFLTSFYITCAAVFILCGSFFGAQTVTDAKIPGYSQSVNTFLLSILGPSESTEN